MSAEPGRPGVFLLGPALGAVSGVSTHVDFLLRSQLARDFSLRHFQVGGEGRGERRWHRLWRLVASPFALALALARTRPALVHVNTSLNPRAFFRDLAYLGIARLLRVGVVYQVHGGALPREFCAETGLPPAVLRTILRQPDALVLLAGRELAAYREFVPRPCTRLVPNGVDCAAWAAPGRPGTRAGGPLRLLYTGRLIREKGVAEALEALALVLARGLEASLVVAGGGPEERPLQDLARRLALGEKVRFAGPVDESERRALYGQADVLLLPTYHPEGLPYALLEGMAAGLPVVTTRIGGIPDVVVAGTHGMFVPPRDAAALAAAIATLACDRPALEQMRAACVQRIAGGYTIEHVAASFGEVYRDVIARAGGPGLRAA